MKMTKKKIMTVALILGAAGLIVLLLWMNDWEIWDIGIYG
jgi:hypothetical protein